MNLLQFPAAVSFPLTLLCMYTHVSTDFFKLLVLDVFIPQKPSLRCSSAPFLQRPLLPALADLAFSSLLQCSSALLIPGLQTDTSRSASFKIQEYKKCEIWTQHEHNLLYSWILLVTCWVLYLWGSRRQDASHKATLAMKQLFLLSIEYSCKWWLFHCKIICWLFSQFIG